MVLTQTNHMTYNIMIVSVSFLGLQKYNSQADQKQPNISENKRNKQHFRVGAAQKVEQPLNDHKSVVLSPTLTPADTERYWNLDRCQCGIGVWVNMWMA